MCAGTQEKLEKTLKAKLGNDKVGKMFCLGHCYENNAFHYEGENYAGKDIEKIDQIIKGEKITQDKFFAKSYATTSFLMDDKLSTISQVKDLLDKFLKTEKNLIIKSLSDSNLSGRGGAGFPTGLKWDACSKVPSNKKYVICNADEGDSGAFSDRYLLEDQPLKVLFGMMICGYVIGSDEGVLYIRGEYPKSIEALNGFINELKSEPEDRTEFVKAAKEGAEQAGLGRRPLIKRSLAAAVGLAGLPAVILLRDLGPLPGNSLNETNWKTGTKLVTDPGDRPIKASDLEVGGVAQVMPALLAGQKRTLEDIAKDAVLLIRLRPSEFQLDAERLSWTHEGIIAFSKICSHMGCAVALYEQTTKHLLCPCHQSTFDVTRAAKVIFGPSARPLPQLAITVDADGYLIAKQPFTEAVGPSFWERKS